MREQKWNKIGATLGLAVDFCNKDEHKAEQVYVRTGGSSQVMIDAWVGYSSVAWMILTRNQAKELIPLLLEAIS